MNSLRMIKGELVWLAWYLKVLCKTIFYRKKCVFLVGTPLHGNLGDHAIALAEYQIFKDAIPEKKTVEIPSKIIMKHTEIFKKIIGKHTVYIHGGGFIGTLWIREEEMVRKVISCFKKNRIVIFPQTVFFEMSEWGEKEKGISQEIYNSHPDLWLCTREEVSFNLAKEIFPKVKVLLVPDMVPYLDIRPVKQAREGAILCLRHDKEKVITDREYQAVNECLLSIFKEDTIRHMDTVIYTKVKNRWESISGIINSFAGAEIIITDRLHGMVFAALAGTPCIVFSNCNQKVRGVYKWISQNKYIYYMEDGEEFETALHKVLSYKDNSYNNKELKKLYAPLCKLMEED